MFGQQSAGMFVGAQARGINGSALMSKQSVDLAGSESRLVTDPTTSANPNSKLVQYTGWSTLGIPPAERCLSRLTLGLGLGLPSLVV